MRKIKIMSIVTLVLLIILYYLSYTEAAARKSFGKQYIVRRATKGRNLYPDSLGLNDNAQMSAGSSLDPRFNWYGNSYGYGMHGGNGYGNDYGYGYGGDMGMGHYDPHYEDMYPSEPYEICEIEYGWFGMGSPYETCYRY